MHSKRKHAVSVMLLAIIILNWIQTDFIPAVHTFQDDAQCGSVFGYVVNDD